MKKCVIYANCQGDVLNKILMGWEPFSSRFTTEYIPNYRYIEDKTELPRELLSITDVLIYQPIDKKREVYCTSPDYPNGIMGVLKQDCIRIAFPYIYNSGPFILYEEGADINNKDVILKLKEEGKTLDEILCMFRDCKIDFKVEQRYKESMTILKEKEKDCNLIVSDYIEENIQTKSIFYTQNHIYNEFYYYIANNILRFISLPQIPVTSYKSEYQSGLKWLSSPYDISYFKYTYKSTPDTGWVSVYTNLIKRIYNMDFAKNRGLFALNLLQF